MVTDGAGNTFSVVIRGRWVAEVVLCHSFVLTFREDLMCKGVLKEIGEQVSAKYYHQQSYSWSRPGVKHRAAGTIERLGASWVSEWACGQAVVDWLPQWGVGSFWVVRCPHMDTSQ